MKKSELIIIGGVGVILVLVLLVSNFNISINIGKAESAKPSQAVAGNQTDSMAGHHGSGTVDTTIYDGLLGKPAPDFTLEDYNGKKISLSGLKGKNVILFFNEGLMCYPSCWNQMATFGKDEELKSKAEIFNITVDPKNNWGQAITKMPELAKATVLFDGARQASKAYGVLT